MNWRRSIGFFIPLCPFQPKWADRWLHDNPRCCPTILLERGGVVNHLSFAKIRVDSRIKRQGWGKSEGVRGNFWKEESGICSSFPEENLLRGRVQLIITMEPEPPDVQAIH